MSGAGIRYPAPILLATLAIFIAPIVGLGSEVLRLHRGAIEVGLAGSLVSVEGSTRTTLALRGGSFVGAPSGVAGGLAGFEVEVGYNHQRALDTVDIEGNVSWQRAVGAGHLYPFASIGGGLRQEHLGSFSQARYPLGFALGLRTLFGARAAVRVEYRYRRVLNDPIADFTEHRALTGISLLLRNTERPERGGEKVP